MLTDAVEAEWPNAIDNWRKPADKKQSQGSPVNCTVNLVRDLPIALSRAVDLDFMQGLPSSLGT